MFILYMDTYLHIIIRQTKHPEYSFLSLTQPPPDPSLAKLPGHQVLRIAVVTLPLFLGKIVGHWKRNLYFAAHLTLATDGCS